MGFYTKLPEGLNEVDVIIVGGGICGCVVASRLADADPSLSILLIEAGPNNQGTPTIQHPAFFLTHLAPESKTTKWYVAKEGPEVAGRSFFLPAGSVLGGGSSMNMMMYSQAQRSDWDSWGMAGWSATEMTPFLKKFETYQGDDPKGLHGHEGPIRVSLGTYSSPRICDEFMEAAKTVGWQEVPDLADSVNSAWRAKRFISPEGERQDAASAYLHPRLNDGKHPNLHALVETQVTRIIISEDKVATGVEIRSNPRFHPDETDKKVIKARKLVVCASGVYSTPSLLERSGVGDSVILERAGVPVLVDLPGVGADLEDHQSLFYPYLNDMTLTDTLDGLYFNRMPPWEDLIKSNHKILGWNGQEVQAKVRPQTDTEVAALGQDFQKAWEEDFKDHPDKPLVVFSVVAGFPGELSLTTGDPTVAVTAFTVYPYSRGHIHITSSGLDDPLDFKTGAFAGQRGELDVKMHMWMYKKQREAMRRMPMYRGEKANSHPPFDAGSGAACVLTDGPLGKVPDIEYTAEDDAVLEKWIREHVSTTWHALGSCKMLPRDRLGVVDSNLSVYEVKGLKIADLSIAPHNVSANTAHTAFAVGEKAADIFIRELGLKPQYHS